MANDNFTQAALANDLTFRRRLKGSLARVAFQVLTETGNPDHQARKAYALQVLANPDAAVANLVGIFVFRTNLFGATTSVQFDGVGGTQVVTAATDAALDSQLATDWNNLSGV
jgi:hypothetical protein